MKSFLLKALATSIVVVLYGSVLTAAFAEHGTRTLDVYPETTRTIRQAKVILIAQLSSTVESTPQHPDGIKISAEAEADSDNDPEAESQGGEPGGVPEDSPETPDAFCFIPAGEYRCSISYVPQKIGTDTWRFWVDEDHDDGTAEADKTEERDDSSQLTAGEGDACNAPGPGDPPSPSSPSGEPDCTDVVEVVVVAQENQATTLDCDDATTTDGDHETNNSGETETYTCRLRRGTNNSTNAIGTVYAEVENELNDPDNFENNDAWKYPVPDYVCVTGSSGGDCTIVVRQADGEPGTSEICFWVFHHGPVPNQEDRDDGGDPGLCGNEPTDEALNTTGSADQGNDLADQAEKTWRAAATNTTTATTTATSTATTTQTGTTTATTTQTGTTTATTTRTGTATTTQTGTTTATTTQTGTTTATTTQTERPPEERVASDVTIDRDRPLFHGVVGSAKQRCQTRRLVTVKKVRPGRDREIGEDGTDNAGNWQVRHRRARGRYYAVAAAKVYTETDGTRVVCERDRSRTIRARR